MPSTSKQQTSTSSMDLTTAYNNTIHVRKRSIEAVEEELELSEEFNPQAVSTPNVSSYTVPDVLVVYTTT